eukprot:jgi/Hompol1/6026/HPOL_002352-RA
MAQPVETASLPDEHSMARQGKARQGDTKKGKTEKKTSAAGFEPARTNYNINRANSCDAYSLLDELPSRNSAQLAEVLNTLVKKNLVEFMTLGTTLQVRALSSDEFTKQSSLTEDENKVYQWIRQSQTKGTWIKDIKTKSGMHAQVVTQTIKNLEKRGLIKSVKSVKHPTKKLYMLSELEPSTEVTGGTWYTDQELDVEFIDQMSEQLRKYIYAKSRAPDSDAILSSSHEYPTCTDLHLWLKRSGISSAVLEAADVQMLLDRLVYDGTIERIQRTPEVLAAITMNGGRAVNFGNDDDDDDFADMDEEIWCYRATRMLEREAAAWTGVPCGKCPVFSFCKEGGPVSPSTCVYLKKWLDF